MTTSRDSRNPEPIAIVGLGCRLPGGANDPDTFWRLLLSGFDAITEIPSDRWDIESLYHPDWQAAGRTHQRHGGFVEDIDAFDATFFGISPKEARTVDPQQRMLLEVAHQALENAGIPPFGLAGSGTGVFVGLMNNDYYDLSLAPTEWRRIGPHTNHGGTSSIAANRISYVFDLRGPSMAIDTACSSSLVALHLATTALHQGECELALVGGANALLGPGIAIGSSKARFLSARGRCQSFSAAADGYVRSEGAAMLVVEPLSRARRLGHPVLALVRHTGVNQDGRTTGMALPNEEAQANLLHRIYAEAGLDPHTVDYVEAHGTGTAAGDPIEARALGRELGRGRVADDRLLMGSVKSNVGHTESAAGAVSLVKSVLVLQHGEIPPSLHAEVLNPNIAFDELGLELVRERRPWPERGNVRRVGVNGFGFGGTNAHAVLEGVEPETDGASSTHSGPIVVTLSARSPEGLRALAKAYREQAEADGPSPVDVAWTTAHHRDHHPHRAALVVADTSSWKGALERLATGESASDVVTARAPRQAPRIAFVCSGQGPQWWGMGRELMAESPVFRATVEHIAEAMAPHASWSLLEELDRDATQSRVHETWLTQPALFALQVGLAAVWRQLGVEPEAVVGHSVGEVAAAVITGALTLEEGARVIVERGRIQQKASGTGRMLAVGLDEKSARSRVGNGHSRVSIAAINRPELVAVSGEAEALEALSKALTAEGVFNRFLAVQVPFHSHLMDPLEDELNTVLGPIRGRPTETPLYSTVTASRIEGPELGGDYWFRNVRQPVRFVDTIRAMMADGLTAFVELSPHPILSPGVEEILSAEDRDGLSVASLRRGEPELPTLLGALGSLYVAGRAIAPVQPGRRVTLPTYPWQRERHWCESAAGRAARLSRQDHPFIRRHLRARSQSDIHLFELELDPRIWGFLKDHRINDALVLPGAASLEAALACGRQAFGEGVSLTEVQFERALFLPEEGEAFGKSLDVRLEIDGDDGRFRIVAEDGDGGWVRHVSGRIDHWSGQPEASFFDLAAVREQGQVLPAGDAFYAPLEARGYKYGPAFRRLGEQLGRVSENNGALAEAVATLTPLDAHDGGVFQLHPAVLDACFQALLGAAFRVLPGETRMALPNRVAQLQVSSEIPSEGLLATVRLSEVNDEGIVGEAWLVDQGGRAVAKVSGFEARFVGNPIPRALTECAWRQHWLPRDRPEAPPNGSNGKITHAGVTQPDPRGSAAGNVAIIGGAGGLGDRLATELAKRGVDVQRLGLARSLDLPPNVRNVVLAEPAEVTGGLELDSEGLKRIYEPTLGTVLTAVNRLGATSLAEPPRVLIVTSGAMHVRDGDQSVRLAQTAVWGLGRVLANEYLGLGIRLVDLPSEPGPVEVASLAEEILSASTESDVALRGDQRFTLALEACPAESLEPPVDGRKHRHYRLRGGQTGLISGLFLEATEVREPGPGEVAIAVHAAGLNFHDVMLAVNRLDSTDGADAFGTECAGTVLAVGPGVDHVSPGQEVLAGGLGTFGGVVIAPAALTWPRPPGLSAAQAAGVLAVFGTAYYALSYLARLSPGERVLIHSAAGGVGLAALQIAQRAGAQVLATAGTPEKRSYLLTLGVDAVFDSHSLNWFDEVQTWTGGRGVDVVLNSLSGTAIQRGIACLAPYGRFVELGKTDIFANNRIGLGAFGKNLSFYAVDLYAMIRERPVWLAETVLQPVLDALEAGELRPLPTQTTDVGRISEVFQTMAHGRHIGKLVVEMGQTAPIPVRRPRKVLKLRPDRTYLVTGGTRGFGLALAGRFVERGARHLMLLSRSGELDAEASERVNAWRGQGVAVHVGAVDVSDRQALEETLSVIGKSVPPLAGVAHAAVVLDDALAADLDDERMWRVLGPKAGGALNLHQTTSDQPLDWFLLLSSVSSLMGNPGQANYNAANLLIEGLAWARRQQGLPATVVNLGALGETGFVARHARLKAHLKQIGLDETPLDVALSLIEQYLQGSGAQGIAARVDWEAVVRYLPGIRSRLSRILPENGKTEQTTTASESTHTAEPTDRRKLVAKAIRQAIAKMLGGAPERLPEDAPITELGIDSLVTAQLTSWIQHELGVRMTSMQLLKGPTIRKLATDIVAGQR